MAMLVRVQTLFRAAATWGKPLLHNQSFDLHVARMSVCMPMGIQGRLNYRQQAQDR